MSDLCACSAQLQPHRYMKGVCDLRTWAIYANEFRDWLAGRYAKKSKG